MRERKEGVDDLDERRIALVTGHIPVSEIASHITVDAIVSKLQIFNQSLKQDFAIERPRIAVLSLNPHAGDAGLIGKEEEDCIKPAMVEAEKRGVMCFGPFPADGFFGASMAKAWLRLKHWQWMKE